MGIKLTSDDRGVKIFRKDGTSSSGNPYTLYSMSVSSKDIKGEWVNGYLDCAFKKGVEVNNKALIKINNAFPTVNEYNGKKTIRYMITDFEVLEQDDAPPEQVSLDSVANDGFMNIPDNVDDDAMPFN